MDELHTFLDQEVDDYRNLIAEFQIFIANPKVLEECKSSELLGRCDSVMQRTHITEFEAAVADAYARYGSDAKKKNKAIEGAHNRCVQKGGDPSLCVAAFWTATKKALVDREESDKKKQKKGDKSEFGGD